MVIMLGNLSVKDMEKRLKIELSSEDREALERSRQIAVNNTPLEAGKWHCYDIPFMMMCDTMETAGKFYAMLSKYKIKGTFQIGYER